MTCLCVCMCVCSFLESESTTLLWNQTPADLCQLSAVLSRLPSKVRKDSELGGERELCG